MYVLYQLSASMQHNNYIQSYTVEGIYLNKREDREEAKCYQVSDFSGFPGYTTQSNKIPSSKFHQAMWIWRVCTRMKLKMGSVP